MLYYVAARWRCQSNIKSHHYLARPEPVLAWSIKKNVDKYLANLEETSVTGQTERELS